jgi:hypothetical protein
MRDNRENKKPKRSKPKAKKQEKKFSPIPDFTKVYGFGKPHILSVEIEEPLGKPVLEFSKDEVVNYPVMSKSINLEGIWNTRKNPPEYMGVHGMVELGDVKVELNTTAEKIKKLYDLFAKNLEFNSLTKNVLNLKLKYEGFIEDTDNVFAGVGMLAELGQNLEEETFFFVFKPDYITSYDSRK